MKTFLSKKHLAQTAAILLALQLAPSALACASCGCMRDSDSDNMASTSGFRFDLGYDYLDQNQLRSGTGPVDTGALTFPNDREVEQDTRTQFVTAGLDYTIDPDWGVNLQIPFLHRTHSSIDEGDTEASTSSTTGLGDMRLLGRYQGFSDAKNFGVLFGLKLPTGQYDQDFNGGPNAGELLDRGLQAGSGTTDAIIGVFYTGTITPDVTYFAQGMAEAALYYQDQYRPGQSFILNSGIKYQVNEYITPELQFSTKYLTRDTGDEADYPDTGGCLMVLSPGVTVSLTKNLKVYGFIHVPVFQDVNGYQLSPRWSLSVGTRYEF